MKSIFVRLLVAAAIAVCFLIVLVQRYSLIVVSPNWASEEEKKPEPKDGMSVKEKDSSGERDGCGLFDANRNNATWIQYTDLPATEQNYLHQVRECSFRFKWSYADQAPNATNSDLWSLQCDSMRIDRDIIQNVVRSHHMIMFAGDSVLRQQYFVLLCMINPSVEVKDMSVYSPRDRKRARYDYNHSNGLMTSIIYAPYGYRWNAAERNLYYESFPHAIRTYKATDAVVLESSRHYDSTNSEYYEKALQFIVEKSMVAEVPLFYMEPTPEEWATSNGFFTPLCEGKCQCQPLDVSRLRGRGAFSDPAVDIRNDTGRLPAPSAEFFGRLFPELEFLVNHSSSCIPNCLPATWRVDLARLMLLGNTAGSSEHHVHLVPIFWQLVARDFPSSSRLGDCTHRSFDGVVAMNQQLIREMSKVRDSRLIDSSPNSVGR